MVRIIFIFSSCLMLLAPTGYVIGQGFYGAPPVNHLCAPAPRTQPKHPVVRTWNVNVPFPQCAGSAGLPASVPPRTHRTPPSPLSQYGPMPTRVDIAIHPETCDQRSQVPVVYRDPGFMGPIISNSVGLIAASIAAPFRLAEMLCPLDAPPCPPKKPLGSSLTMAKCGCSTPMGARFAPHSPVSRAQPISCSPVPSRVLPGPSVAPLPRGAPHQPYGPCVPPAR